MVKIEAYLKDNEKRNKNFYRYEVFCVMRDDRGTVTEIREMFTNKKKATNFLNLLLKKDI